MAYGADGAPPALDPPAAASVAELQRELRHALATATFDQAVRASVHATLRDLTRHVLRLFPAADAPPLSPPRAPAAAGEARPQAAAGCSEVEVAPPLEGGGGNGGGAVGGRARAGQAAAGGLWGVLGEWGAWWAGGGGGGRRAPAGAAEVGATGAHLLAGGQGHELVAHADAGKPPRKTARLLRPVQQASDELFGNVGKLSQVRREEAGGRRGVEALLRLLLT